MSDIELVIKIPEKIYKYVQLIGSINMLDTQQVANAIFDGKPLPKGHGRLIDADALCDYFWDNRSKLYTHKDLQIVIDNAPTIIEADKESEGYVKKD